MVAYGLQDDRTGAQTGRMMGRLLILAALVAALPVPAGAQDAVAPATEPNASEMTVTHGDVRLAGTLRLPDGAGPFPAAVLITGSGVQDRDETLLGHKPFRAIADDLAARGVATLRLDDRGAGGSSPVSPDDTTLIFADDIRAAVAALRLRAGIDPARVGLTGHSEGGVIAPLVAADDPEIAFVVLLAGQATSGGALLADQQRALATASGAPAEEVEAGNRIQRAVMAAVAENADSADAVVAAVKPVLMGAGMTEAQATLAADPLATPWYRAFVALDPAEALGATRAPILAIYGERDTQVPARPNAERLRALVPTAEIVILPALNHLFQQADTGLPNEYARSVPTPELSLLDALGDWVAARAGATPAPD